MAWLILCHLSVLIPISWAAPDKPPSIEVGRRIYEEGILPGGVPLRALRAGVVLFEGKNAACATCHRRSGMGSVEGFGSTTVLVPPVAGPLLFNPARFHGSFLDRSHHWVPNDAWARALTRSAYDEASFERALREGVDADGKRLSPMPQYPIDDQAFSALVAYLKQLAGKPAPGVEEHTLHLATIITPDVPKEQANAILDVLRAWSASARGIAKSWQLHVWELTGPAENWGDQLQKRYLKQPVYAVLSGAGGAQWSPVHTFCEKHRVPCILPSVEVMPKSGSNYYSVYYSPGVTLEAQVLANYLNHGLDAKKNTPEVVQFYSDATGEHAARSLQSYFKGRHRIERRYSRTKPEAVLARAPAKGSLVLWLRADEISQLVAASPQPPAVNIYLSALLAPPEEVSLPAEWKARVSWVSLFDDIGVQGEIAKIRLKRWLKQQGLSDIGSLRVQADAYAASYLFTTALSAISGEEVRRHPVPLGREHLLEALETLVDKYSDGTNWVNPDSHVAYYGRMSLAPGQRVAVRGGALLRYASSESRKLIMASDRIIP